MKERWIWKRAAMAVVLAAMLTGCGNAGEDAATETGQASAGEPMDVAQLQLPERTADLMGKVVSVTPDSIVLQKSKTQPADMPGGGMGFGGRQRGDGSGGRGGSNGAPQGERPQPPAEGVDGSGQPQPPAEGVDGSGQPQPPAEGVDGSGQPQPPAEGVDGSGQPQPPAEGSGGRGNRGQAGGFGGQMEFLDEQVTVKLTADTELFAMAFGEGGMTNNRVEAADLQSGDILTLWLDEDQSTVIAALKRTIPEGFRKAENTQ
ncbi:hypothetical protein [Paenibacillus spongiae]|uniref:Lipoprotein n=1 Tax=Paenibacillus spongiae TaxID=2909671 RepID=A0ABY5S4R2_9BACL|nr:hypothetical protein [Paenibacillus spongiae]UVI28882.1 hypothetical protein L1F29_26090 [Paenibacillus spongiae]